MLLNYDALSPAKHGFDFFKNISAIFYDSRSEEVKIQHKRSYAFLSAFDILHFFPSNEFRLSALKIAARVGTLE